MKLNAIPSLVVALLLLYTSCKKDDSTLEAGEGSLEIEFENRVNNAALQLGSTIYKNANNDDFTISTFKYYVSTFKLTKTDGSIVSVPEAYFLIDASVANSNKIELKSIPSGDYKNISFVIGVDSLRNFAGAQTGALDPVNGMFWTWNSGYIFVKLEGNSPQSTASGKTITFHIGGAKAPNNTLRTFSTALNTSLRIRKDKTPEMHFITDAATLFKGSTTVKFADLNFSMGGASSVKVADNYATTLFKLDHIHN